MNPRTPTPTGSLSRAPPTLYSPTRSTQPPSGLVKPQSPPKDLISGSASWIDRTKRQTSPNSPTSNPMIPFPKQDGNRHGTIGISTWKITTKIMVPDTPSEKRNNEETATVPSKTNTDTPSIKNGGQSKIPSP